MNVNAIVSFLERENNKFYHVMIDNLSDRIFQKYQISILCWHYDVTTTRDTLSLRLVYDITSYISSFLSCVPCRCDYSMKFNQLDSTRILHISSENFIKLFNEKTHDIFPSDETVYLLMTKQKTLSFLRTVPFLIQTKRWEVNGEFLETWSEMITKIH